MEVEGQERPDWMAPQRTHTLLFPIVTTFKVSGGEPREETITSVVVRRPKGKDIARIDGFKGNDVDQSLFAIGLLTGMTEVQTDKLDGADIEELGEIIEGFRRPGRATGGTSSET